MATLPVWRNGAFALALGLGAAALADTAEAQSWRDPSQLWSNGPWHHQGPVHRYVPRRYYRAPAYSYAPEWRYQRAPAPQVQVESPEYYTYEPDVPVAVRFSELCEMKVAANTETPPETSAFTDACNLASPVVLRVLPEVGEALKEHYAAHPRFVWLDDGRSNTRAQAAIDELARAAGYGLSPADYQVVPLAAEAADARTRAENEMRFELALSAKVLTYVLDATRGRVAPNRISGYHDIARKSVDLAAALGEIAQADDVAGLLRGRHPDNARFAALVTALEELEGAANRPRITIPDDTHISPGDEDPALANVLAAIQATASAALKQKYAHLLAEEHDRYRGELVSLVRDFQREQGLRADGVVGPRTVRAMMADTAADKIAKLRLAMERLRWLPSRLGDRYVLLNQPAFEVTFIDGPQDPLTMKVIIGETSNQTYVFTDTIEAVEYNPYWNVPRSIVVNEMLPKLYRDPGYFDRLGYEVITASGRQASSWDVDWGAYARKRVSVDVRQPPGPKNALGRLKIKFPNNHAIYMHDTPQKSLFERPRRAFSHGCVRLQEPRVMAARLLGKPVSHVDARIRAGGNEVEPVGGNIPVYLAYFTAWPDLDGTVRYYDDVYKRDAYLARAIEKTEAVRRGAS